MSSPPPSLSPPPPSALCLSLLPPSHLRSFPLSLGWSIFQERGHTLDTVCVYLIVSEWNCLSGFFIQVCVCVCLCLCVCVCVCVCLCVCVLGLNDLGK